MTRMANYELFRITTAPGSSVSQAGQRLSESPANHPI